MDNNVKYVMLTDNERYGTVVKCYGRKQYIYQNGEWVRSGVLVLYQCDESPYYDLYKEITKEEAEKLINEIKAS